MLIKNTRHKWFSDYNCLNKKICEVDNKLLDTSSLATTTVLNAKLVKLRIKFQIMLNISLLKNGIS